MKKFIPLLAILVFSSTSWAQSDLTWLQKDLIEKWENNKTYTTNLVKAMPEEHFDFVPIADLRTFESQASHIGDSFQYQIGKTGIKNLPKVNASSKATILKSYEQIFDTIIDYLETINPADLHKTTNMWYGESTYHRLFCLADNHMAHHRGQMIVYLRLKGITPPKYLGW